MEKINFVNNSQPAINATNLNKLQQNVEDVTGDLSDLETSDRDNLVEAINEAKRSGGDAVPIHSIFDYDGDTVPTGYEEVNSYSTSEVKTGDTWIDGRPIYRKVIQQNVSDTTDGNIPIDITGVNDIWINTSKTFFKWSSFPWKVPIFYQTSSNYLSLYINDTNIKYYGKLSNYNLTGTFYIVLEYTKTTD